MLNATRRSSKEKAENVSVEFRSWEVNVKFYKDRFGDMGEAEVICRRLTEIRERG